MSNSTETLTRNAVATPKVNAPFFNYSNPVFDYEPFPIAVISPVIEPSLYEKMVDSYPDLSLFKKMSSLGNMKSVKYSLAEMNNGQNYFEFLAKNPVWKEFYDWIKSPEFLYRTLEMLSANNVELGLYNPAGEPKTKPIVDRIKDALTVRKYGHKLPLSTRFEFSIQPADGGQLRPHTDSPGKIITLVVTMTKPGEWNHAFGGGTDMMRPKRTEQNFNWVNRYLDYEDVETFKVFDFNPNQCLIFIKTHNSWHAVRPMTGEGSNMLRRTLTINIETRK